MDEAVKNTYNTVFRIFRDGQMNGCDAELASILIRHADNPNRDSIMRITYDLYKKYGQSDINWDALILETSNIYEKIGRDKMYFDLMDYFVKRFEKDGR